MSAPDIAKIVSMIMENPKLIEEISAMANSEQKMQSEAPSQKEESGKSSEVKASVTTPIPTSQREKSRSELLCALKPYVSKDRAQAIDSMISVVEILDLMKRR